LVTGGAGFIGSHLCDALLGLGHRVIAFDNFDPFYGRDVKLRNLAQALEHPNFTLVEGDIRDADAVGALSHLGINAIVHLAALAGVRPSIEQPDRYYDVNVMGTQVLLDFAKTNGIKPFVFASSSSVYGNCPNVPWTEDEPNLRPISPYASTNWPASTWDTCTATCMASGSSDCAFSRYSVRGNGPIWPSTNSRK